MHTIKLHVEDSKVDIVVNIIQSLKENLIATCEIIPDKKKDDEFVNLSYKSLEKIWDNNEDIVYDKFLKI